MKTPLFLLLILSFVASFSLPAHSTTIWTPEPWELISDQTPPAPGQPLIQMVGGRNGMASGLVVARGDAPFSRPAVEISDLRNAQGKVFPARLVTIRYGSQDHRDALAKEHPQPQEDYFHLSTTPLPEAVTLVARLTAHIPANAPAGEYRGEAIVNANGRHRVPVLLQVGEGILPLPGDYVSHVNYPSSPDSVALRYGVAMWSKEHWEKLAASFAIFRMLGQNVIHIPVILQVEDGEGKTSNLNHYSSQEGMIRFREQGGRVVPDFGPFEEYLRRWREQVGEPQFIVLWVWDVSFRGMEEEQLGKGLRAVVTGVDAQGKTSRLTLPYPSEPGTEELWKEVMTGARERVRQPGWDPEKLLIGITHDGKPLDEVVEFYNKVAPGIHWNNISHMRGYGIKDGKLTVGSMQVGYQEYPQNPEPGNMKRGDLLGGWNADFPLATIARFHSFQTENALSHRWLGDGTVGRGGNRRYIGPTRGLIEFWPVPRTGKDGKAQMGSLLNMQGWVNLIRNRTNLGTAGPEGLEPSVYLLNDMESIQDTEARIAIEKILNDSTMRERLPEELVHQAQDLIVARGDFITANRKNKWAGQEGFDYYAHALLLYNTLGAMQQATGEAGGR